MLWFIKRNPAHRLRFIHLNTSYVMVHPPYFKPFLKYDILIFSVFKRLPQIFTNRSKKTSNLSKYRLILLFSMVLALFRILWLVKFYIIKLSPVSFFASPRVSSSKTLSFINFIMQIKSSSLSIT